MPGNPHDDQQHTRAPDDLEAAEAAGALSFAAPGSTEADDFDMATADDLDAFDKELLKREGPDALTSDRAYRMAQFKRHQAVERDAAVNRAERDPDRVGFVLMAFRRQRGWSREQLADWLGIATEDYGRLASERRPLCVRDNLTHDPVPITPLAERFGAHPERLIEAFEHGDQ
jgi:hypothetical protein